MVSDSIQYKTVPGGHNPFSGFRLVKIAPVTPKQSQILSTYSSEKVAAGVPSNLLFQLRLTGLFDAEIMKKALAALHARQEALRLGISSNGKTNCIYENGIIRFAYNDISGNSEMNKERYMSRLGKEEANHRFNLCEAPLLRTTVIRLEANTYYLLLCGHPVVFDRWGLQLLARDLGILYSAFEQNRSPVLQKNAAFSDYALSLLSEASQAETAAHHKYWLQQFRGNTAELRLPSDFPRPAERMRTSQHAFYTQDIQVAGQVKLFAAAQQCSTELLYFAALELLLYQVSGQPEFVIGLQQKDRLPLELEQVVGQCSSILPLKSCITAGLSCSAYLARRIAYLTEVMGYSKVSVDRLIRVLDLDFDPSHFPLLPVLLSFEAGIRGYQGFEGFTCEMLPMVTTGTAAELHFSVGYNGQLGCSFHPDLYKKETVLRLLRRWEHLLRQVVGSPDLLIHELSLGGEPVETTSRVDSTAGRFISLQQAAAASALQHAGKTALIFGSREISFSELEESANRVAHYLVRKGTKPGDIIALVADRSPLMLISLFGILKAGGAFLPISPEFPPARVSFMLEDAGVKMLICSRQHQAQFPQAGVSEVVFDAHLMVVAGMPATDPLVPVSGTDLAYIIYTSGSTGKPKGVMIAHQSILNYIDSCIHAYVTEPGTKSGSFVHLSLTFDAALTAIFVPLFTGKTVVMSTEKQSEVFNDPNLVKYAPYDFIKLTPAQFSLLEIARDPAAKFATQRYVVGGEALYLKHLSFLADAGFVGEIVNEYGPTEATVGSIFHHFRVSRELQDHPNGFLIGRPMPNVAVHILNKDLQPVAVNEEGAIYLGGIQLASGYLNRPELTAEKFIKSPFPEDQGCLIYHTGDHGKFDTDGNIRYTGRIDEQVKIRSYRIETGEIEARLLTMDPIKSAIVLAKEYGKGDQRLVAFILTHEHSAGAGKEQFTSWRKQLRQFFPEYMVPAHFILVTEFPLTVNGKVDRSALLKLADQQQTSETFVSATTKNEKIVASVWKEYFGIEMIGMYDNFFELGGHSLIAVQIMNRLEIETGRLLPLSILFEHATIHKLAKLLDEDEAAISWDSLVPIKTTGNKIPLYMVHGAGSNVLNFNSLAMLMDPEQPVYGLQAKGLNGVDEPIETIEGMAAFYNDCIIRNNPGGPYALAGYSFGGVIAFEMARQLRAMGKTVIFTGIFDTDLKPSMIHGRFCQGRLECLRTVIRAMGYNASYTIRHPFAAGGQLKEWATIKMKHGRQRLRFAKAERLEQLDTVEKMYLHHYNAICRYEIQPADLRLHLFCAQTQDHFIADPVSYGWKRFALKGIETYLIPGDHHSIFITPNNITFARVLQQALDGCRLAE